MFASMTYTNDKIVLHPLARERLLRKLRRLWLRSSGRPQPAKLLEILERRIAEKSSHARSSRLDRTQ